MMLSLMPQRVFREWVAYTELEPWDEQRADWRSAMVAHTMYSLWRGKGPRRRLADFLPKFKQKRTLRTPQDALRAMARITTLFGGRIEDKRPEKRKLKDGPLVSAADVAEWKQEAGRQLTASESRGQTRRGRDRGR